MDLSHGVVVSHRDEGTVAGQLLELIGSVPDDRLDAEVSNFLQCSVSVLPYRSGETVDWAVITPARSVTSDPELRQVFTDSTEPVPLDRHSRNVALLARRMAEDLGLGPALAQALEAAGQHHDAGKADPRFQSLLGSEGPINLAKSGARTARERWDAQRRSGLPQRWRHEQLSAVEALEAGADGLVIRLVGTSHGWGRPLFPHGSDLVPEPSAATQALFGNGTGWSDILESTERRFGVWGCAYLEAVLRSADGLISRDGS